MQKNYFFLVLLFLGVFFTNAQETVTISGYNGAGSTLTVSATSNVNQTLTIVFEDVDIIQNFYTQFQNSIFMYGGLDTNAGGFQGAPDFNDLLSQPELNLTDADNNIQPNTYSITINLAQHYTGVPNGTTVYGFNLLFQNQFGGGGNNQTLDLYIDLADADKDDTLSLDSFSRTSNLYYSEDYLIVKDYQGALLVNIYDVTGKQVETFSEVVNSNSYKIHLDLPKHQVYFVSVTSGKFNKTIKIISN